MFARRKHDNLFLAIENPANCSKNAGFWGYYSCYTTYSKRRVLNTAVIFQLHTTEMMFSGSRIPLSLMNMHSVHQVIFALDCSISQGGMKEYATAANDTTTSVAIVHRIIHERTQLSAKF
jgi:hypothetical protein